MSQEELREPRWLGYFFGNYAPEVQVAWDEFVDKHCRTAKDGKPATCICPYDSKRFTDPSELSTILVAMEEFEKHVHENPDHEHKLMLEAARIGRTTEERRVKIIQQPSAACRDEWKQKARCPFPDCRKWNILDYMGFSISTCEHFKVLEYDEAVFRGPKP